MQRYAMTPMVRGLSVRGLSALPALSLATPSRVTDTLRRGLFADPAQALSNTRLRTFAAVGAAQSRSRGKLVYPDNRKPCACGPNQDDAEVGKTWFGDANRCLKLEAPLVAPVISSLTPCDNLGSLWWPDVYAQARGVIRELLAAPPTPSTPADTTVQWIDAVLTLCSVMVSATNVSPMLYFASEVNPVVAGVPKYSAPDRMRSGWGYSGDSQFSTSLAMPHFTTPVREQRELIPDAAFARIVPAGITREQRYTAPTTLVPLAFQYYSGMPGGFPLSKSGWACSDSSFVSWMQGRKFQPLNLKGAQFYRGIQGWPTTDKNRIFQIQSAQSGMGQLAEFAKVGNFGITRGGWLERSHETELAATTRVLKNKDEWREVPDLAGLWSLVLQAYWWGARMVRTDFDVVVVSYLYLYSNSYAPRMLGALPIDYAASMSTITQQLNQNIEDSGKKARELATTATAAGAAAVAGLGELFGASLATGPIGAVAGAIFALVMSGLAILTTEENLSQEMDPLFGPVVRVPPTDSECALDLGAAGGLVQAAVASQNVATPAAVRRALDYDRSQQPPPPAPPRSKTPLYVGIGVGLAAMAAFSIFRR